MNSLVILLQIGLALAVCSTAFADGVDGRDQEPQAAAADSRLPLRELRAFTQVFEQIRRGYVDEVDDTQLLENAIVGLLLELDPVSYTHLRAHET